jgi:ATP/maltotriose-dependent transcriptional regulator MalT
MILNLASVMCIATGDYDNARRHADTTLRLVEIKGYSLLEMSALHNQAAADLGGWNYRQAFLKIKEAERLARRAGDAEEIVWAEDMLGDLCRRNKNPQQAIEHHSQALELLDDRRLSVFERARATCAIGMDQAVAGRDSEAQRTLEEAARLSRQWSLIGSLSPSLFYLGWLHAKAGREQAAVRFLVEAMKLASDNEHVFFYSQEARVATPILALCDRVGAGAFIRQRVLPTLPSRLQGYFFELAEGPRYPTDSTLGPPKKGRLGLGNRESHVEVELDEAVLGRIATLTDREREVLKMVALGMSNKKIGSELFITEKTVKTHTNHIFRKLGVSSRMQATFALQGYQRARIKALHRRNGQPGTR